MTNLYPDYFITQKSSKFNWGKLSNNKEVVSYSYKIKPDMINSYFEYILSNDVIASICPFYNYHERAKCCSAIIKVIPFVNTASHHLCDNLSIIKILSFPNRSSTYKHP